MEEASLQALLHGWGFHRLMAGKSVTRTQEGIEKGLGSNAQRKTTNVSCGVKASLAPIRLNEVDLAGTLPVWLTRIRAGFVCSIEDFHCKLVMAVSRWARQCVNGIRMGVYLTWKCPGAKGKGCTFELS
jgi:hypothetical protein